MLELYLHRALQMRPTVQKNCGSLLLYADVLGTRKTATQVVLSCRHTWNITQAETWLARLFGVQ